jgi:phage-related protein
VAVSILGEAAIRLRPETSSFVPEAEAGVLGPISGVAKKAAGLFAAAFAAEKVGEFLKESVTAASDVSESTSKVGVVFGQASQSVLDFASKSAAAMGMSRGQALEATGTFGNLFRALNLGQGQSADMSTSLVKLAGDLASFNNVDPAVALDALRSGLVGETEPLRQFGVNMNAATLKQEALKLGLDASGPTLSAAVQAQAAYALILDQTSLAQGDFTRTGQGLANQQRIMSAQFADLQANVGAVLVPLVTLGAHVLTGMILPGLLALTRPLAMVGQGMSTIGANFHAAFDGDDQQAEQLLGSMTGLGYWIDYAASSLGTLAAIFSEAFADGQAGADLLAQASLPGVAARLGVLAHTLEGVGYTFTEAFQHGADAAAQSEAGLSGFAARVGNMFHGTVQSVQADWASIRAAIGEAATPSLVQGVTVQFMSIKAGIGSALSGVGDTIRGALAGAGAGIEGGLGSALGGVGGFLRGLTDQAVGGIAGLAPKVLPFITGLVDQILPVIQQVVPIVTQVFQAIVPVVSSVFSQVGPLIGQVLPVIEQVAGLWRGVLMGAFQALLPVLPTIVTAIGQLVTTLVGGLAPVISTLAPVIGQVVTLFQGALIGAIQALVPIIPPLVAALAQVAQIIGGALLGVIQALTPVIPVLVGVITQLVGIFQQGLSQALQAIIPILPVVAQLLGQVATMLAGALASVLQALLPILPPLVQALMTIAQVLIGALMSALQAILPVIPLLLGAFIQLIQAALIPLLPILPLLANLLATIISALAPLIPVVIQVVVLLVQLAVAAIMPLLPVILILANLITMLISVLVPIIQVTVSIIGAFINFAAVIISVAINIVSTVIRIWTAWIGLIFNIYSAIFSVIRGVWTAIFGWISGIVSSIAGTISNVFSGVIGAISRMFAGIGGIVSDAFGGAAGVVRSVVNGIIGVINGAIGFINSKLIDTANKIPFVSIPHIPNVPRLHEGGVFTSGVPAGEGLALLRDNELVVTPEQRATADDLLRALLGGNLGATTTTNVTGGGIQITNHITQLPGESGAAFAARANADTVWNLNNGVTRRVTTAGGVAP